MLCACKKERENYRYNVQFISPTLFSVYHDNSNVPIILRFYGDPSYKGDSTWLYGKLRSKPDSLLLFKPLALDTSTLSIPMYLNLGTVTQDTLMLWIMSSYDRPNQAQSAFTEVYIVP